MSKTISEKDLISEALKARDQSFSPFSKFKVGAALLTDTGEIYKGTNVEVSSYGLTVCAERHAIGNAIVEGERKFSKIVVASNKGVSPCGACRQVLYDVCGTIDVIMVNDQGDVIERSDTASLLPGAFNAEDLNVR